MPDAVTRARHHQLFDPPGISHPDGGVGETAAAAPTQNSTKAEILAWLAAHGIEASDHMTKAELLELAG